MSEKVRVLYFVDRMLRGGIQTFVIENMKYMDKEKIQIDFLLLDDGVDYELEDTLKEMGANVYKLHNIWLRKPWDYLRYFYAVDSFFKKHHDYQVVHMHSSSKNFYILKAAKKYGISTRIAHAHSTNFMTTNKGKIFLGNFLKRKIKKYATDYFACSIPSGKWMFGIDATNGENFRVIHNAVEYNRFRLNQKNRIEIRKKLQITDETILFGNVGRFSIPKNHTFLVDVFNEIHRVNSNTKMIFVGKGELEEKILRKVTNLNLEKDVIFEGFKENVNDYMSAMDVFIMPSLYEGFPIVGVEAQASGLPCFMSEKVITDEIKITELVKFIPLEYSAEKWANIILSSDLRRKETMDNIKRAGYFIEDTASELERFYISSGRRN